MSPTQLNPAVWRMSTKTQHRSAMAECLICNDGKLRRVDNCSRHENTRAHEDALLLWQQQTPLRESLRSAQPGQSSSDWNAIPFLSDLAMRRLLESFITRGAGGVPPVAGEDNPTEGPAPPPRAPHYDWNLFDAYGGISVGGASEEERGVAQIAEAMLQYLDHDPDAVNSDDEIIERSEDGHKSDSDSDDEQNPHPSNPTSTRPTDAAAARYWYPWPNRISCTLDILMHLPRSVFSHRQLDLFLWLLSINGITEVPSVKSMQSLNKALQKLCGIETIEYEGKLGNRYFVNSLAGIVAQEMANPKVRPHLHFFPEDAGPEVSEARQAARWLNELDDDQLTPMARIQNRDFYIHEPAYLRDGTYCMPTRWIMRAGSLFARCWKFELVRGQNEIALGWRVIKVKDYEVPASEFLKNFPEMRADAGIYGIPDPANILCIVDPSAPNDAEPWLLTDPTVGNPWRAKALGHRVVAFPIWLYCDDTSGNTTKKWNEHNSFLFTPAGLPRAEAQKEFNVHFLTTSNLAFPLEMLDGITEQLQEADEKGIWAWDCELNEPVLVLLAVLAMLGDNPMQSEFACHIGLRGKFFCRVCHVKGKDAKDNQEADNPSAPRRRSDPDEDEDEDEDVDMDSAASDAGSTSSKQKKKGKRRKFVEDLSQMVSRVKDFIKPGRPRTKEETIKTLNSHFEAAKSHGSESKVKEMRTKSGIKDTFQAHFLGRLFKAAKNKRNNNREEALKEAASKLPDDILSPVWRIKGLDPHRDTPVEILHVILLGFVKYFWRDLIQNQLKNKPEKLALLITRLDSLDVSGLGLSPLCGKTLVTYCGSLTGRDFRAIAQVAPYVIYDLVSDECREAWLALSKLIPLIWQPEIKDINLYVSTVQTEIRNFLLKTAQWTPRWFNKPKFHVVVHIPDHIRRLGPAMLFATEAFESFNAVIRAQSVHSNRHAPSRDIAHGFAQGNRIRHLLSGGLFLLRRAMDPERSQNTDVAYLPDRSPSAPKSNPIPTSTSADWTSIGAGPTSIVASPSVVTEYLGHGSRRKINAQNRQGRFVRDKTAAIPYSATLTAKVLPGSISEMHQRASYYKGACLHLVNGDKCPVDGFVMFRRDGHLLLGRLCELLQRVGSSATFQQRADLILLQNISLSHSSQTTHMYGMPEILQNTDYHATRLEDIIATVNVQHDCASQECEANDFVPVYQERKKTTEFKARVAHKNYDGHLVLNTAQMRDGRYLQTMRIASSTYTEQAVDDLLVASARKEFPVTKTARRALAEPNTPLSSRTPPSSSRAAPALSQSTSLRPPPSPSTSTSRQVTSTITPNLGGELDQPATSRPRPRPRPRPNFGGPIPPVWETRPHYGSPSLPYYPTASLSQQQHVYGMMPPYSSPPIVASQAHNINSPRTATSSLFSHRFHPYTSSSVSTTSYSPNQRPEMFNLRAPGQDDYSRWDTNSGGADT